MQVLFERPGGYYLIALDETTGFVYCAPTNESHPPRSIDAIQTKGWWEPYEGPQDAILRRLPGFEAAASVLLSRVYVGPHERVTDEGVVHVDGYWRESGRPLPDKFYTKREYRKTMRDVSKETWGDWWREANEGIGEDRFPDAARAINFYSGAGYDVQNLVLRYGRDGAYKELIRRGNSEAASYTDIDRAVEFTKLLRDTIDTAPRVKEPMTSWRGGGIDESLKVGDTFTDPGFVSTSLSKAIADSFGGIAPTMRVNVPPGTKAIMWDIDENNDEQELLLQAGTTFKVVSLDPPILEVVPDGG